MTDTSRAQPATRLPARFAWAGLALACALLAACGDQGGRPAGPANAGATASPGAKPAASAPAPATVEAACLSPAVPGVFKDLLAEGVEARARDENKDLPDHRRLDLSKVRATAALARVELQDVVTTKNDPNSTKKFCEGTLHLSLDTGEIAKADAARRGRDLKSVRALAEDMGFRVDVNRFTRRVAYSVQPTDDRSKLFVSLDDTATYVNLMGEAVLWAVAGAASTTAPVTSPVRVNNSSPNQDGVKPPEPSEGEASLQAELSRSQQRFNAAEREINVVWRALPKSVRDAHLIAQRQFNKDKEVTCFRQANAAGSGARFEIVKNHCWADLYDRRTAELRALN